jgi:glycosyltransferase involved in cell wall biosynthesis
VAGALVRLIEDRKLRARMGAYNRRRRRELFGVARMIGEYADLYRRLSGRVRGPAPHGSDAPGRIAGPLLT